MTPELVTYPVITLWQPWASWVAEGWKTIETRKHNKFACLAGRRILIHAGNRLDNSRLVANAEQTYLSEEQKFLSRTLKMIRGKILCSAWIDGVVRCEMQDERRAMIECKTERYGLLLSSIEKFDPPIRVKGKQGIWYFDMMETTL